MSGDVQARKRKDKRKRRAADDGIRQEDVQEKVSNEKSDSDFFKDESDETEEQEHHDPHHGHHAGICAKIIFFILFSGLFLAMGTIFFQLHGSDVAETPIKESRYASILENFVDEHPPDDHEEHHAAPDEHDEHGDEEHDEEHTEHEELIPDESEEGVSAEDEIIEKVLLEDVELEASLPQEIVPEPPSEEEEDDNVETEFEEYEERPEEEYIEENIIEDLDPEEEEEEEEESGEIIVQPSDGTEKEKNSADIINVGKEENHNLKSDLNEKTEEVDNKPKHESIQKSTSTPVQDSSKTNLYTVSHETVREPREVGPEEACDKDSKVVCNKQSDLKSSQSEPQIKTTNTNPSEQSRLHDPTSEIPAPVVVNETKDIPVNAAQEKVQVQKRSAQMTESKTSPSSNPQPVQDSTKHETLPSKETPQQEIKKPTKQESVEEQKVSEPVPVPQSEDISQENRETESDEDDNDEDQNDDEIDNDDNEEEVESYDNVFTGNLEGYYNDEENNLDQDDDDNDDETNEFANDGNINDEEEEGNDDDDDDEEDNEGGDDNDEEGNNDDEDDNEGGGDDDDEENTGVEDDEEEEIEYPGGDGFFDSVFDTIFDEVTPAKEDDDDDDDDDDDTAFNEDSRKTQIPDDDDDERSNYAGSHITNDYDYGIREELDEAQGMLGRAPDQALQAFLKILEKHPKSPRALYGKAQSIDRLSEVHRSNQLLEKSISIYRDVLDLPNVPDDLYKLAGSRCADRMRFRGFQGKALKVLQRMSERFPGNTDILNQVAVSFLLLGKNKEAQNLFKEVLKLKPTDGFSKAHYGFILKTEDKKYKEAIQYLSEGIQSKQPGTNDGRFYFHLGDALTREGRTEEAYKVYEEAVELGLFLSVYQRSLYNVKSLTARPWWTHEQSTYGHYLAAIEAHWKTIRSEAAALVNDEDQGYFPESEGLKDKGVWKQFEMFVRGQRVDVNCMRAPKTCQLVENIPDAAGCTRGQIKFSLLEPGTHVWPHTGPTNCRLRAHLGLIVPSNTRIRVANETRTWEEGKFIVFDDSFEHEVWNDSDAFRLILIIDFWHPDLTESQRKTLTPI